MFPRQCSGNGQNARRTPRGKRNGVYQRQASAGGAVSDEGPWPDSSVPAGARVAGYRLDEQIGRGGMAVVYRAHDIRLERPVAIQVLSPELAPGGVFRQ